MASALRFVPISRISHRPSTPPSQFPSPSPIIVYPRSPRRRIVDLAAHYRSSSTVHGDAYHPDEPHEAAGAEGPTFDRAVSLFNAGDYHRCHDYLEELWNSAEEPVRTILHGILQCAVGFHHLFNQNHRGAMMELGEGLCKLRKMGFESGGPLFRFEKEVSEVLEFVYQTQMELAACTDDICVTMDGSERSYQLLGSFAAGQRVYRLDMGSDGAPHIVFCPNDQTASDRSLRVRVPTLTASGKHLEACEYSC